MKQRINQDDYESALVYTPIIVNRISMVDSSAESVITSIQDLTGRWQRGLSVGLSIASPRLHALRTRGSHAAENTIATIVCGSVGGVLGGLSAGPVFGSWAAAVAVGIMGTLLARVVRWRVELARERRRMPQARLVSQ